LETFESFKGVLFAVSFFCPQDVNPIRRQTMINKKYFIKFFSLKN